MSSRAQMFDEIDRMDADAWASHLAPDAVMRFGNADPVHDREVSVPVVTIYRTDGRNQIADYRVYIDLAPVFAPVAEQPTV